MERERIRDKKNWKNKNSKEKIKTKVICNKNNKLNKRNYKNKVRKSKSQKIILNILRIKSELPILSFSFFKKKKK